MQKPQNCNQDWSKMTPAKGGRICGSCEKLIIDFSKKSWKEIENKQAQNNNSLCGVYSEKQLKHWGKEVPKSNFCSKNLLYASMILSMNAATNELQGKTNIPLLKSEIIQTNLQANQFKNQHQPNSDSLITITGKIIDEQTGEILLGAMIHIQNTEIGASTDVDGNFMIKNYNISQHNSEKITLIVDYLGYKTQEITLGEEQMRQRNLIINPKMTVLSIESFSGIAFSVTKQTPWQRFKSRVRRIFRRK
jgi:hypothetical protein